MSDDHKPAEDTFNRIEDAVRGFGLGPQRYDTDGKFRIGFVYQFDRFLIKMYSDDPSYIYVSHSFFASKEIEPDLPRAYILANRLSQQYKAIKVVIDATNDLIVSYESFLQPDFDITPILERILNATRAAANEFFSTFRNNAKDS